MILTIPTNTSLTPLNQPLEPMPVISATGGSFANRSSTTTRPTPQLTCSSSAEWWCHKTTSSSAGRSTKTNTVGKTQSQGIPTSKARPYRSLRAAKVKARPTPNPTPKSDTQIRHLNPTPGVLCGPVSRYACRLVADRHPPYSVRLYAAGFNPQSNILLSESAPKWPIGEEDGGGLVGEEKMAEEKGAADNEAAHATQVAAEAGERGIKTCATPTHSTNQPPATNHQRRTATLGIEFKEWDALTTFGVRIWRPEVQAWREISVMGSVHEPRTDLAAAGKVSSIYIIKICMYAQTTDTSPGRHSILLRSSDHHSPPAHPPSTTRRRTTV